MNLGILFTVCDADERHFDRFEAELRRLAVPFACNFDHCCDETVRRFSSLPKLVGYYRNDDPESHFDESHRQFALDILVGHKFEWMLSLDVDETLERGALSKMEELTRLPSPPDVVDFRVLDLWGDGSTFRVDGPFSGSHREKLFRIGRGRWLYYHPTIHAPKMLDAPGQVPATVLRDHSIRVLHWGMMDQEAVEFHCKRWDAIYERKVGANPYGFYKYLRDPANVPVVKPVPENVL